MESNALLTSNQILNAVIRSGIVKEPSRPTLKELRSLYHWGLESKGISMQSFVKYLELSFISIGDFISATRETINLIKQSDYSGRESIDKIIEILNIQLSKDTTSESERKEIYELLMKLAEKIDDFNRIKLQKMHDSLALAAGTVVTVAAISALAYISKDRKI